MAVKVTWLGHSAFTIDFDGSVVLLDPFLTGNPLASTTADAVTADLMLLSHAHGDHLGDTIDIAKRLGVTVVGNFEIGNWLSAQGISNVHQGNPGGTYDAGFVTVKFTMAHHSSSFPDGTYGGEPNGFILTDVASGQRIYFAGDTSLLMDMQLIGDEGIDLAILPIGDTFTMGVDDSVKAVKLIRPKMVMPMHYNTFPPIVQDASAWGDRINNETDATPVVIDPGGTFTLE